MASAPQMEKNDSDRPLQPEQEYFSTNNHRPFQESLFTLKINPNPCADGKTCRPEMAAASRKRCIKTKPIFIEYPKRPQRGYSHHFHHHHPEMTRSQFQVQMRTEEDNDVIEYNVEQPNHVAVRMDYLMQTTKARVNDRRFMDELYLRLMEEEAKSTERTTKLRELPECNRVKKLVINGLMAAPEDMLYLNHHPVFRVNAMLKRLDQHNRGLFIGPKIKGQITPVEPYEFDGDQFFQHLHQHGTYWIPSEEKLAGKIGRAKLRVLEKRLKQAEQEKLMKILHSGHSNVLSKKKSKADQNATEESNTTEGVKTQIKDLEREIEKQTALLKRKKAYLEKREMLRQEKVTQRQKERDYIFLEDRETERLQYLDKYELFVANRALINPLDTESQTSQTRPESRKGDISKSQINLKDENGEIKNILKSLDIGPNLSTKVTKFHPYANPLINSLQYARFTEAIKKADEILGNGKDIAQLQSREVDQEQESSLSESQKILLQNFH